MTLKRNLLDQCWADIHELFLVDADSVKHAEDVHKLLAGVALTVEVEKLANSTVGGKLRVEIF